MRVALRFSSVALAMLGSGCGLETVTPAPALTCEPGPTFTASVETCEFTTEGGGGPVAVHMWIVTADDGSNWNSFERAPDGAVYLFGGWGYDPDIVARLAPGFSPEWSRRIVHAEVDAEDPAKTELHSPAVGDDGLHVVSERNQLGQALGSWLVSVDEHGECGEPVQLEFDGETAARVGSIVREADSVVLAGISQPPDSRWRGYVQRRDFAGKLLTEVEIEVNYGDIEYANIRPNGLDRYLLSFGGYAPQGYWSSWSALQSIDASLTVQQSHAADHYSMGIHSDARGHLHGAIREEWDPVIDDDPASPSTFDLTRLATADEPAGETISRTIPQPQCGYPSIIVFDESVLTTRCDQPGLENTLLGYEGAGDPSWTTTLNCPSADDLSLGRGEFTTDGQLWLHGRTNSTPVIVVVEF